MTSIKLTLTVLVCIVMDKFLTSQQESLGSCFEKTANHALIGAAKLAPAISDLESCFKECAEARNKHGFQCKSLLFYPTSIECILNTANKTDTPDLFLKIGGTDQKVDYYENICDGRSDGLKSLLPLATSSQEILTKTTTSKSKAAKSKSETDNCFEKTPGHILVGATQTFLRDIQNVSQCTDECLQSESKYRLKCLSFMYYSGQKKCALSDTGKDQMPAVNFLKEPRADYYQYTCVAAGNTLRPITTPPSPFSKDRTAQPALALTRTTYPAKSLPPLFPASPQSSAGGGYGARDSSLLLPIASRPQTKLRKTNAILPLRRRVVHSSKIASPIADCFTLIPQLWGDLGEERVFAVTSADQCVDSCRLCNRCLFGKRCRIAAYLIKSGFCALSASSPAVNRGDIHSSKASGPSDITYYLRNKC